MADHPILFKSEMVRAILDGCKTQTRRVIKLNVPTLPNTEGRLSDDGVLQFRCPPENMVWRDMFWGNDRGPKNRHCKPIKCPYGVPGDLLWVRENVRTICYCGGPDFGYGEFCIEYLADNQLVKCPDELEEWWRHNWHVRPSTTIPAIHMPKAACRLWLRVKSVRVERVQEISDEDVVSEGIESFGWDFAESSDGTGQKFMYWDDVSKDMPNWCPDGTTSCECATDIFSYLWDSINAKRGYGWEVNPFVWVITFERVKP